MKAIRSFFSPTPNPYAGIEKELNDILSRKEHTGPCQVYDLIKFFKSIPQVPHDKIEEYTKLIGSYNIDINPIKGILNSIDQPTNERGSNLVRKVYALRAADTIGKMLLTRPIINELEASPPLIEGVERFPSSAIAFSFLPKGQRHQESLQLCLNIFESTGSITQHILSLILQKPKNNRLLFIQDLSGIYQFCNENQINLTYINTIMRRISHPSSEVNKKFMSDCLVIIKNLLEEGDGESISRFACALMIYSMMNGTDEHKTATILPLFSCFDCTELLGVFTENDLVNSPRKRHEMKCLTAMLEHLKNHPDQYNLFYAFFMRISLHNKITENALTNTYLATTLLAYNRIEDNYQKDPELTVAEFKDHLDAIFPEDNEMPLDLFEFFLFHYEELVEFFDLLIYFSDKPLEDYLQFIEECKAVVAGRSITQYDYIADIRDALSLYITFNFSDSESYQTMNFLQCHAITKQRQQETWLPNPGLIEAISRYLKLTDTLPEELPKTVLVFLEIIHRENYLGECQIYDLISLFEKSETLDRKSVEFIKLYLKKHNSNEKNLLDLAGKLLIPKDQRDNTNTYEIYSVKHYGKIAPMFAGEKNTQELLVPLYDSFSDEKLLPFSSPGAFIAFKLLDPTEHNRGNLKMCLYTFKERYEGYVPALLDAFLLNPELRISRLHGFCAILQSWNYQETSNSLYIVISLLENQPQRICEFMDQCMSIKNSLSQNGSTGLNENLIKAIKLYGEYLTRPPRGTYSLESCYSEVCEKSHPSVQE